MLSTKEMYEVGKWIKAWRDLNQDSASIAAEIAKQFSISLSEAEDAVKYWMAFHGFIKDDDMPSVFGDFISGMDDK